MNWFRIGWRLFLYFVKKNVFLENKCIINRFPIQIIHLFCLAFILFQPIFFSTLSKSNINETSFLKDNPSLEASFTFIHLILSLFQLTGNVVSKSSFMMIEKRINVNSRDYITFDTLNHWDQRFCCISCK